MVAPPWFTVPPSDYGGIESVIADLVEGLQSRGHEVLLVAPRGSDTAAESHAAFPPPPVHHLGQAMPEVVHTARTAEVLTDAELDLVHDHTVGGPLLARSRDIPTVVTVHGPLEGDFLEYYRALGATVRLVSLSEAQRAQAPDLAWLATVPNGVDVDSFPFREHKDDYLVWLGRFCEDKAPHLAIDAARAVGLPIVLAGKCVEPDEKAYFEERIRPRLGDGVDVQGIADATRKRELLAAARAFLFPIQWEEPFGLVMVEALACGTPVVAIGRGAATEVIVDGVTGFLCAEPDELPNAITKVSDLRAADCRERARGFDLDHMVSGYEAAYRAALDGPPAT